MHRGYTPYFCSFVVCLVVACTGQNQTDGSATGGVSKASAGATTGGVSTGGLSARTGGAATGGTNTTSSTSDTGGASNGGASNGGAATGGTSATGAEPMSCQSNGPGLSDCGQGESCCASVKVPGGTFYRSYTNDGSGAKNTADPATISDFRLDMYLVTVARFRKFVAAWDQDSGYTPAIGSGKHTHLNGGKGLVDSGAATPGTYESGWLAAYDNKIDLTNDTLDCQSNLSTWSSSPEDNEKHPMNCINWFEAYAFCIWDGGFLASEAEYEYAAAGGSEQRRFPWGATAPGKNNDYAIWGCYYPDGSGNCDGTLRNIAPVGTARLGAGKWGQLDLVGNLIQWNLDWFAASFTSPCTDCANLASGSGRAPRDGYYGSTDEALLQSFSRNNGFYPANRFQSYGFRCARTP